MRSIKCVIPVLVFAIFFISCKEKKQESPEETSQTEEQAKAEVQEFIDVDISGMSSAEQGSQLKISNSYREEVYTLHVRKVQATRPGITSISAIIEDRETGLAIITVRDGRLSGSLEFYKENLRYQIRYDSSQSRHYLVEVTEPDDVEGSAPLEAPKRN